MIYNTQRLTLRTLKENEASLLREYLLRNRNFLEIWEPSRADSFFNMKSTIETIRNENKQFAEKQGLSIYVFKKGENNIIGNVKLSNIVYGIFLSCYTGYKLDEKEQRKGYMTEALSEVVRIAFREYKLHRIEANIMPKNIASQKVVKKLGFENEGKSRKYLKINGRWEDHYHYVLLNEDIE